MPTDDSTQVRAVGSDPAAMEALYRDNDARRGTVRSWLLGIASHRLADLRRQETRERAAATRAAAAVRLEEDERTAVDARIDAMRRAEPLRDALAALPAGQRDVLHLVALDGLSPSEAAGVLGVRPITARVRLARARRSLAERERADASSAPSMRRSATTRHASLTGTGTILSLRRSASRSPSSARPVLPDPAFSSHPPTAAGCASSAPRRRPPAACRRPSYANDRWPTGPSRRWDAGHRRRRPRWLHPRQIRGHCRTH